MTGMNHPPIYPEHQAEPSLEEAFAGKMMTLLAAYNYDNTQICGDYQVTYPITDRIDIMLDQHRISGALRIKRLQTFALAASVNPNQAVAGGTVMTGSHTEDYSVLALEYGHLEDPDLDIPEDDDFVWNPYVMAVANYETGETDLLDGATGQLLSGGDFAEASHRLDFFARQISDKGYEHLIRGYDTELTIHSVVLPIGENRTLDNMFHPFDHEETHADLYESHECSPVCPLELHPESNQN